MVTVLRAQVRHRDSVCRRQPLWSSVPEERVDVEHVANRKTVCLGCGFENGIGKRFCEVCGRIVVV